jgi:hypothetical protein
MKCQLSRSFCALSRSSPQPILSLSRSIIGYTRKPLYPATRRRTGLFRASEV